MLKSCSKCKIDKDVSEFYIKKYRGNGLAGYSSSCKMCEKIRKHKYYEKNKDIICIKSKKYKHNNKDYYSQYALLYRVDNKEILNERSKNWREDNKDDIKLKSSIYYQNNKNKIIEKVIIYQKERMKTDSLYKLTRGIRALILISLKNQFTKKSKKTQEILGCSFEEFKIYLESLFDENMNWDNQGTYWHMDHKTPISWATTEEQVYKLNHYTNFQPLFKTDNLSKGNKYESK